MAKRLTEPQQRLLAEIRESSTGGMYVRRSGRYHRTAQVLLRLGLVTVNTWGAGHDGQYWYEPVPEEAPPTLLLVGSNSRNERKDQSTP